MTYLTTLKEGELESRFNAKLGYKTIKIKVYLQYLPHADEIELICVCESKKNNKKSLCVVLLDRSLFYSENIYEIEEKWLENLVYMYKETKRKLK